MSVQIDETRDQPWGQIDIDAAAALWTERSAAYAGDASATTADELEEMSSAAYYYAMALPAEIAPAPEQSETDHRRLVAACRLLYQDVS